LVGWLVVAARADYYLERQAGCEEDREPRRSGADLDYYAGDRDSAGVWMGGGAEALGLSGRLDDGGEEVLRAFLDGRGADGAVLVRPVMRANPRGLVPARPLVTAIEARVVQLVGAVSKPVPPVLAEASSSHGAVVRDPHCVDAVNNQSAAPPATLRE
jgi:hypothetical protein